MRKIFLFIILITSLITVKGQENKFNDCLSGWSKYEQNPILGGIMGTFFDVSIVRNDKDTLQMYCTWYDGNSIALTESKDGLKWSSLKTCLNFSEASNNRTETGYTVRPSVIIRNGVYYMWYTGLSPFKSWLGYAISNDGKHWKKNDKPVMEADKPWEQSAVLCPHVLWDEQENIYKIWYSAGNDREPDAIGYATSADGINWTKDERNPIFIPEKSNSWEKAKVSGCQVIKRKDDYLMFYIGYCDPDHAQIGMARSKDGITNWERYNQNPIIGPGEVCDSYAVYKPFAIPDPKNNRWLLFYNGRRGWIEQIGIVVHKGMDLGF
jgi:beta-1,2-mannobiose phosphorylase / 1,2-beta-oligomannan phosphorylase